MSDDFNDPKHELKEDAAAGSPGHVAPEDLLLYTLELIPEAEKSAIETHLQGCEPCRQELIAVREAAGVYTFASVPLVEPPQRSRDRLLAEVAREGTTNRGRGAVTEGASGEAKALPVVSGSRVAGAAAASQDNVRTSGVGTATARRTRTHWTGWVGWAVAAILAIAAVHFYQARRAVQGALASQAAQIAELSADEARARQTVVRLSADQARARQIVEALEDRSAQRVLLTRTPTAPEPTGRATYLAGKGTLIFLASHLAPLAPGKTYELWLLPANGSAPVPAGTFQPDVQGNASVVTAKLTPSIVAKGFAVTAEPAGGSTTPTMPILLSGS